MKNRHSSTPFDRIIEVYRDDGSGKLEHGDTAHNNCDPAAYAIAVGANIPSNYDEGRTNGAAFYTGNHGDLGIVVGFRKVDAAYVQKGISNLPNAPATPKIIESNTPVPVEYFNAMNQSGKLFEPNEHEMVVRSCRNYQNNEILVAYNFVNNQPRHQVHKQILGIAAKNLEALNGLVTAKFGAPIHGFSKGETISRNPKLFRTGVDIGTGEIVLEPNTGTNPNYIEGQIRKALSKGNYAPVDIDQIVKMEGTVVIIDPKIFNDREKFQAFIRTQGLPDFK